MPQLGSYAAAHTAAHQACYHSPESCNRDSKAMANARSERRTRLQRFAPRKKPLERPKQLRVPVFGSSRNYQKRSQLRLPYQQCCH